MPNQQESDLLNIHVNVHITPATIQAIVGHAKRMANQTPQGSFHIDTAEFVSAMISRFLKEKDFESYAQDANNYSPPPTAGPDA